MGVTTVRSVHTIDIKELKVLQIGKRTKRMRVFRGGTGSSFHTAVTKLSSADGALRALTGSPRRVREGETAGNLCGVSALASDHLYRRGWAAKHG